MVHNFNTTDLLKELESLYSVLLEQSIINQFQEKLYSWEKSIKCKVIKENPYGDEELKLSQAENVTHADPGQISDYLKHITELSVKSGEPFNTKYWHDELVQFSKINEIDFEKLHLLYKLLIREWRKYLDKIVSTWELNRINELQAELIIDLKEWLDLLTILKETLDDLSMETGFLWDLSKNRISLSDIVLLKKWVDYIKNNESVKELCDLMGRIKRYDKSAKQEQIFLATGIKEFLPDVNSKEEIIGIKLGRDLENILPQEIVLLSDDLTSILFDIKFAENRLMCFEMQGLQPLEKDFIEPRIVEIEERELGGPLIICVDTSGSMQGTPENIAKALTLILAAQAFSEKRDCLLINFSTSIETLILTFDSGMEEILNFLQKSFYGGTDVLPVFSYALGKMQEEQFKHADMLVISDFIMTGLNQEITDKIIEMKNNNNRFFSLSIGELFLDNRLHEIFDGSWIYNPRTTSIDIIKQVYDSIL